MIRRVSIKHACSRDSDETESAVNEKDTNDGDEENVEENGVEEEPGNEQLQVENEPRNDSQEKEEKIIKPKSENAERKRGPDNQTLLRLLEQVFFIRISKLDFLHNVMLSCILSVDHVDFSHHSKFFLRM